MTELGSHRGGLVLFWRSLGPYHVARAEAAARALAELGVRTLALELCEADEMQEPYPERAKAAVKIHTIAPGVRLFNHLPSWAGRVRRFLDEVRPAYLAVAGYLRPEMRAALRWANRNGAVAVLMSETKWDDRPRSWWKRAYASWQVGRADAALVSGAAAGEYLVTLGMPREFIFRQYGTVDNAFFVERTARFRSQDNGASAGRRPYFLACSRLVEKRKNLVRLLLAYERYRRQVGGRPWDLVFCGEGPDRRALEDLVRQRSIEGITFAGFQQPEGLAEHYARASCFIHAAMNEAWGLVVNEAMAAGLPVLVSRRCGCAYDLVEEGITGWTFNPYDVEELAGLMITMTESGPARLAEMGSASQQRIQLFGPERFAKGLLRAVDAVPRTGSGRRGGRRRARDLDIDLPQIELAREGVAYDGPRYAPSGSASKGKSQ